MKLVNARLGLELEFLENQVLNLTIESPERFSEVVYNLSKQVEGEEGEFILSNAEKELLLEKKAVVIANPLGVTCDEKRIVSQIYKNLSEKISSDYSEEYAVVNQQILQFVEKIINYSEYNLTLDVDFQATGLVKYCNVHMDSCYDNFAEKFIDYLRAVKMICNVDIVFVLNLKQYFSIEELKEIYKHCFYTKLSLMNLEGIKTDPIGGDRYVILDKDLFTTWEDYAIMAMVEKGLGIGILPEMILKRIPYQIAIRSFRTPYFREIVLAMKNRKKMTPAVEKFIEYLKYKDMD